MQVVMLSPLQSCLKVCCYIIHFKGASAVFSRKLWHSFSSEFKMLQLNAAVVWHSSFFICYWTVSKQRVQYTVQWGLSRLERSLTSIFRKASLIFIILSFSHWVPSGLAQGQASQVQSSASGALKVSGGQRRRLRCNEIRRRSCCTYRFPLCW